MAPSACLTGCLIVLATFSLAGGVFAATNSISTNVNDTTISTEGVFSGPFVPNIQCSKECSGPPELPPSLLDAAAHLTNICANMVCAALEIPPGCSVQSFQAMWHAQQQQGNISAEF